MRDLRMVILRYGSSSKQTLGSLFVFSGISKVLERKTLELPWKNNAKRISCIPAGIYWVQKRFSKKYGWHFHVKDVRGRSLILIHVGNFHHQILGCILPGQRHVDIDKDGLKDVTSSARTMEELLGMMPSRFRLKIIEA